MHMLVYLVLTSVVYLHATMAAPPAEGRQAKNLPYYDYIQTDEYNNFDLEDNDYVQEALDENDISRAAPSRKRIPRPPSPNFNSPIYYIRMPPQPYMFVPGLGYISQPAPAPISQMSQFYNLPVSFVANGKPSTIYQWAGGFGDIPPSPPPKPLPPKRPVITDSTVHRLPGQFAFNGKPDDIFVLRDSYNSLYNDALQNFYP